MISFFAPGIPAPKGSLRAVQTKHMRYPAMLESSDRCRPWMACVALEARRVYAGAPLDGPLRLEATFYFPRPKKHYTKAGLRPDAPTYHVTTPDADKCLRAIGDALTGILWQDDRQLAEVIAEKLYRDTPGCEVTVTPLG